MGKKTNKNAVRNARLGAIMFASGAAAWSFSMTLQTPQNWQPCEKGARQ
jgi:hypothetical protein